MSSCPEEYPGESAGREKEDGNPAGRAAAALRALLPRLGLKAGEILPPRDFWLDALHVGPHALGAGLRLLEAEGLLHRSGKRYRLGPARPGLGEVLVLQPGWGSWRSLYASRARDFAAGFAAEMELRGMRVRARVWSGEAMNRDTLNGTLVIGNPGAFPDFEALLAAVVSWRRPAFVLDASRDADEALPLPRGVGRLCISEKALCDTLLDHLKEKGHRHLAYAGKFRPGRFGEPEPWSENRKTLLRKLWKRKMPQGELLAFDALWRDFYRHLPDLENAEGPLRRACAEQLRKAAGSALGRVAVKREALQAFLAGQVRLCLEGGRIHPRLTRLLEVLPLLWQEKPTAWIAANDAQAYEIHHAFLKLRLEVPEAVSLLSVDHALDAVDLPVSTVDPGWKNLAAQAAAAFAGSGPVPVVGRGRSLLIGKPSLIERGSVASRPRDP